jgi:hypothetical protein
MRCRQQNKLFVKTPAVFIGVAFWIAVVIINFFRRRRRNDLEEVE